tara:strand:- start:81645 stop:81806 length:162 start_codon:yes stop_codon:yes gene_type:complete
MSDYIKPREKKKGESYEAGLARRIEENIEFYYECNNKYMVGFLEEILSHVESN